MTKKGGDVDLHLSLMTFELLRIMNIKMYVAPKLEVLEVLVEQGFAGSNSENDPTIEDGEGFPF